MSAPKKEYKETQLPGGLDKLFQVCEDLRTRNKDGYLSGVGGLLAKIKGGGHVSAATTCSPFTGTVIGAAFDPKYPRDDLGGDAYQPMCNGGEDPLPFADFYRQHNDKNDPVGSIIDYGLGTKVELKQIRRGDQIGIDWWKGAGHSVFCWDVHLDKNGDVDCFQILGSHGPSPGYGVHVYWAHGKHWLTGSMAKAGKPGSGSLVKASDKIFVLEDEVVSEGVWFGIPGVKPGAIDPKTFRVKPKYIVYAQTASVFGISVDKMRAARFHYGEKPPAPYCMKDGAAADPAPAAGPPGHLDVQSTVVKAKDLKADADAPAKVPPKPATQDKAKPLDWQHEVEAALHQFHRALWIEADPGDETSLNDAKSQAALKELQGKLKLDADGIAGPKTRAAIAKQLPACLQQNFAQIFLTALFKGGKLKCDPGAPDGTNHAQTREAVKEFQSQNGLDPSGLPDADTLAALQKAIAAAAPSDAQHGLNPALLAVYWLGNTIAPGGTAKLRVVSLDVKTGTELQIFLKDARGGAEIDSGVKLSISGVQSEVAVPLPQQFGQGALVVARVKAAIDGGKTLELPGAAPLYLRGAQGATGDLETFFKFKGEVGESSTLRDYTYVAYRVKGKPGAWCIKGRLQIDVDGAPNCYDPKDANVNKDYLNVDLLTWKGSLDNVANGGHAGKNGNPNNWFGVVTDTLDEKGTPIVQGPNDPFPGFYVASTSLVDQTKKTHDTARYVDARKIPYLAFPQQVWKEGGPRFIRVSDGHTGALGDLLTAVNPKADAAHRYAHAIFADMGGADDAHFGEGSPALGQKIHAAGVVEPRIFYIIYPGSGAGQGTIPTAEQIHEKGEKLFKEWGGTDEAERVLKLMEGNPAAPASPKGATAPAAKPPDPPPKPAPKPKDPAPKPKDAAPKPDDAKPVSDIATVQGDDIFLDPPLRNLPQYDGRWGQERIAGPKTSALLNWQENGCNASVAAMILRWFAEDCKAGKLDFPVKSPSHFKDDWYSLKLAECFWPNADPPGKVALNQSGRIDVAWIYGAVARYLKTGGDLPREKGDIAHPDKAAHADTGKKKPDAWMQIIKQQLQKGPCIVGIYSPPVGTGHFIVGQGVVGGDLLVVDPGKVLWQAAKNGGVRDKTSGKVIIEDWGKKDGYLDGNTAPDKVHMPKGAQWKSGKAPGAEGDGSNYIRLSGQFLNDLLTNLISVTSLTFPEGPKLR